MKVLFVLFGLYAGIMSWLFKSTYQEFKELKRAHEDLKLVVSGMKSVIMDDFEKILDKRFDRYLEQLDEKLDSWWSKIECNLMNDGRLPPKRNTRQIGGHNGPK